LVQRELEKDTSEGGIIIPDIAKEKLNRGTVLSVGRGKVLENGRLLEPSVKTGDRVIFGKYSGQEFEHEGQKNLLILREDDIFGIVE
jgi:chaperonin GroES